MSLPMGASNQKEPAINPSTVSVHITSRDPSKQNLCKDDLLNRTESSNTDDCVKLFRDESINKNANRNILSWMTIPFKGKSSSGS
jgi:hypothetical protein